MAKMMKVVSHQALVVGRTKTAAGETKREALEVAPGAVVSLPEAEALSLVARGLARAWEPKKAATVVAPADEGGGDGDEGSGGGADGGGDGAGGA